MKWLMIFKERINKKISPRTHRKKKTFFSKRVFLTFAILILVSFLMIIGVLAWYSRNLPRPGQVVRREGFTTRLYDYQGRLLYDIYQDEKRTPIIFEEVPQDILDATIAIEDKEFYEHAGFSIHGILRAFYNIIVYRHLQGGSTLTQQLVKNVLLTPERTITRKIKEFILAIQIERKFSKNQILEMYLNEAPYGGPVRGIAAAAEFYFDKPVGDLGLEESAFLAGLPQKPTTYSPFGAEPTAYIARTQAVLRRMYEDGYINQKEQEGATEALGKIDFALAKTEFFAPHFIAYVQRELVERFGEEMVEKGGLKVTTSLDLDLQKEAEKIVTEQMKRAAGFDIGNAGVIVLDPATGKILAMVGSKDYNEPKFGKVNVVIALRQPGSAIKPVTYVAALKRGYTAAHLLFDVKTEFPGASPDKPYIPTNYTPKFHGPIQARYALGSSKNIPAIKMLAEVGLKNMLTVAYDMGLETLAPSAENLRRLGLAVTLGGGEVRLLDLSAAYCAFANQGWRVTPQAILKVEDKDGKILDEFTPKKGRRVLSAGEAFIISDILSDNNARLLAFSPNSLLNITGRPAAVKTGTTNQMRDNWAVGWTPQVMVGVWVGNNDNAPMKKVASGLSGATPIWRQIILHFLKGKPRQEFVKPDDVASIAVDKISGAKAHDDFPSRQEYFIKGTEPTGEDKTHVLLKVCRNEGNLATPLDIARDNYEEKEFFELHNETPYIIDEGNTWQKALDKWLESQDDSRYHPPTEYCQSKEEAGIKIESPNDHATVDSQFSVAVTPLTLNEIEWVKIFVDNQEKRPALLAPYRMDLLLSDGVHHIKARLRDSAGKEAETEITIGVKVPWDWSPALTPTSTPAPTPMPSVTVPPLSPTP